MRVLRSTRLRFVDGRSDKLYYLNLIEQDNMTWEVIATYGRTGGTMQATRKGRFQILQSAMTEYRRTLEDKLDKGYQHINEKGNFVPGDAEDWTASARKLDETTARAIESYNERIKQAADNSKAAFDAMSMSWREAADFIASGMVVTTPSPKLAKVREFQPAGQQRRKPPMTDFTPAKRRIALDDE